MSTDRSIPRRGAARRGRGVVARRLAALTALSALTLLGVGGAVWQHRHHLAHTLRSSAEGRLFSWSEGAQISRLSLTNAAGHVVVDHHQGEPVPWRVAEPQATAAEATAVDALLGVVLGASQEQAVPDEAEGRPASPGLFGLEPPRMQLVLTGPDGQEERLEVGDKNTFNGSLYVRRGSAGKIVTCAAAVEQALDKSFFDLRDKRVVTLPSTTYASIAVQAEGGPGYSLARQGDSWRLTAPLDAPAERPEAEALAGAIGGLRAKRFVVEHGADAQALRAHGLATPLYRATVTDDTQASAVLRVGRAAAGPSDVYYAQLEPAGPIVELGSDWLVKKLSIGLWELRDRHLASFQPQDVARLSLRQGEQRVGAHRAAGEGGDPVWTGEGGEGGEAPAAELDGHKVAALLQRLAGLQASGVVAERADARSLAHHGLDRPALEVVLEGEAAGEGDARPLLARLQLGAASAGAADRLAVEASGGPLWRIPAAELEGIEASLAPLAPTPQTPPATTAQVP